MENKPNKIIWHHTGDPSTAPQAEKINESHESRGFPQSTLGFYGGYHYLIEHDGTLVQYRNEAEYGAHDAGENVDSLGIGLAGNFSVTLPTFAQQTAFAALLSVLCQKYRIPLAGIEPHRKGDTTECPGKMLKDGWAAMLHGKTEIIRLKNILAALQRELEKMV